MKSESQIYMNSFLLATFICETIVCSMINWFIPISNISVFISIAIILLVVINNRTVDRNILKASAVMIGICLLLLLSGIINSWSAVVGYFFDFICFGFSALMLCSIKFYSEYVSKYMIYIYGIYILFYNFFYRKSFIGSTSYWSLQMGIAYAFLPIIILGILVFFYPELLSGFKRKKIAKTIAILEMFSALLFVLADCGTRGVFIAVMIATALVIISKNRNVTSILLILVFFAVGIGLVMNIEAILMFSASILNKFNINPAAINKAIRMISNGNSSNGRNILLNNVMLYFKEDPFFGKGIGYFEMKNDTYVHNLIGQLMCEGGIFGIIVAGILIVKPLVTCYKEECSDLLYMFMYLTVIPALLFSHVYWEMPGFWLLFFMMLAKSKKIEVIGG